MGWHPTHVSAPLAKRAPVQLGTLKWPFSTPQRAFPFAAEGDTIHIMPGVHDYENAADEGLADTVTWYRNNESWWRPIKDQDPAFRKYYQDQYGSTRS